MGRTETAPYYRGWKTNPRRGIQLDRAPSNMSRYFASEGHEAWGIHSRKGWNVDKGLDPFHSLLRYTEREKTCPEDSLTTDFKQFVSCAAMPTFRFLGLCRRYSSNAFQFSIITLWVLLTTYKEKLPSIKLQPSAGDDHSAAFVDSTVHILTSFSSKLSNCPMSQFPAHENFVRSAHVLSFWPRGSGNTGSNSPQTSRHSWS